MYEKHDKPALNLVCPKCGCKIATTRWEKIDLDETEYEIFLVPETNPKMEQLKIISKITGDNYIHSKELIIEGSSIFKGKALEVKSITSLLESCFINYKITPDFPYSFATIILIVL